MPRAEVATNTKSSKAFWEMSKELAGVGGASIFLSRIQRARASIVKHHLKGSIGEYEGQQSLLALGEFWLLGL
jgi:predicted transcriptional regulator with HTH domain